MNSVVAEVKIVPIGTATTGLSKYVAACVDTLKRAQGVDYQLTAMGTIIQGPLEKVLTVVRQMHEVPFSMGARRVVTYIDIDDRRDKVATMAGKVEAVVRAGHKG